MEGEETVFDRNYEDYLAQLENIPIESIAPNLGGKVENGVIKIPLFGIDYDVSVSGITDPYGNKPTYDVCVVLSKYLLLCPEAPQRCAEWVSFRDLKDSGPLTNYFNNDVERSIASYFKGNIEGLKKSGKSIGCGSFMTT